jgi:hypothetical protein
MPHPSCTRAPIQKKGDLALKVKFVIGQNGALAVAAAYLNSMDFTIYGVFETSVQANPHKNMAALCSIAREWAALHKDYLHCACCPHLRRLEHVVTTGGDYTE